MRATLEFTLPDEADNHIRAVRANDAWACLDDIDQQLRNAIKHGHSYITVEELANHIRSIISETKQLIEP